MEILVPLLLAFIIAMSVSISAFAANQPQTTVTTEDCGNGITAVVTTTVWDSMIRGTSERNANRTWTIYSGSTSVGIITLEIAFQYNGSTAWVDSNSTDHTTKSRWSYSNLSVAVPGGKCSISGRFTGFTTGNFTKSISCSPSGVIS